MVVVGVIVVGVIVVELIVDGDMVLAAVVTYWIASVVVQVLRN
jgi:hypothetical protein